MIRLAAGTTGSGFEQSAPVIDALPTLWQLVVAQLTGGRSLRPLQRLAVEQARILETRQHLVVSAPTNSGKSLVGNLVLLDAVLQGRRAILLEPLRVLAQQQYETLSDALAALPPSAFRTPPKISLSTGDYRQEGELPADAPANGEIIVATPERLDAILRRPENANWVDSIGALVIDEAHMLSDPRRGPTLELLVASMLSTRAPPRIALLSATMGEPEKLQQWLQPCQILTSSARTPLRKEVWALSAEEDPDEVLAAELATILSNPSNATIVFVYQRRSAESLARKLRESIGSPVQAFHSGLSSVERSHIRAQFISGSCRCLVATTALAMGVNLPATHVLIRDTTFYGFGRLQADEILQILGRAGRGDRPGYGAVLTRPNDAWSAEDLQRALQTEVMPPLRSSFERSSDAAQDRSPGGIERAELAAASLLAGCLSRGGVEGTSSSEITRLLGNTLGGRSLTSRINVSLQWLCDPARLLAYKDDAERFHLTVLGRSGARSMLPLPYVAALGQLIRDLMSLTSSPSVLKRWSLLDHLFILALLSERAPRVRRFSEALAEQVDGWMEARPMNDKSFLFTEWVMGTATASKAEELLGSLGVRNQRSKHTPSDWARKQAYTAMIDAIVLSERSRGVSIGDIERRWAITGLDGLDETWRDTALWLLAGHAAIFDIKCFYHHLRETCSANPDQIRAMKHALRQMRGQAYDLLEELKYVSPLGPMLRSLRASLRNSNGPVVGVGTIRKLEGSGITTLQQVARMQLSELEAQGVARHFAKQLIRYSQRRLR